MKKYKEALDRVDNQLMLKISYINENDEFFTEWERNDGDIKTLQELVDIYPEYLELKERATPKKINTSAIEEDDNSRAWAKVLGIEGFCPSCDYQVSKKEKYCRMCGQALDGSSNE